MQLTSTTNLSNLSVLKPDGTIESAPDVVIAVDKTIDGDFNTSDFTGFQGLRMGDPGGGGTLVDLSLSDDAGMAAFLTQLLLQGPQYAAGPPDFPEPIGETTDFDTGAAGASTDFLFL